MSLSRSLQPPSSTSFFPSFTHKLAPFSSNVKRGALFQTPFLWVRDFIREENFSSHTGGLTINKGGFGLSIRVPRNLLHYIQSLSFSLKFRVLLSSHQQNNLTISLPSKLRIWDFYSMFHILIVVNSNKKRYDFSSFFHIFSYILYKKKILE